MPMYQNGPGRLLVEEDTSAGDIVLTLPANPADTEQDRLVRNSGTHTLTIDGAGRRINNRWPRVSVQAGGEALVEWHPADQAWRVSGGYSMAASTESSTTVPDGITRVFAFPYPIRSLQGVRADGVDLALSDCSVLPDGRLVIADSVPEPRASVAATFL